MFRQSRRISRHTAAFGSALALATIAGAGCATAGGPAPVSPQEIPALEASLAQNPDNASTLLRYASALFAGGRCDSAVTVARRGQTLQPNAAIAPLIMGPCYEERNQFDVAIAMYTGYLARYPNERGAAAVRARELLARRAHATQSARDALAREAELATQTRDNQVIAVLPLTVAGDSSYQPLSRGLAQMIVSDLGLLEVFQMVERMQLGAILDELRLTEQQRVDAQSAARVGYLVSAGRMVQGLANIPPDQNVRLEASVVSGTGEVTDPQVVTGAFPELLEMEKQLVVGLAAQLGYQLSQAERQLILENGTRNLIAFLAYSRGLEAEALGDFAAAAAQYAEAVRADPNFRQARSQYEATAAAPRVQQAAAADVTTLSQTTVAEPTFSEPIVNPVTSVLADLVPTHSEQTTERAAETVEIVGRQSSSTVISAPPPPDVVPPSSITATIRIVFRIP